MATFTVMAAWDPVAAHLHGRGVSHGDDAAHDASNDEAFSEQGHGGDFLGAGYNESFYQYLDLLVQTSSSFGL